ncbi:MAG: N-acetylmuramoyl-L-alanine amidase [Psychroserpens sp.]|nr:N-acetylmuramoyl-L-alanine amidase [Psychroserpens sp.]
MSKLLYILVAGHGGMRPNTDIYVTKGKCSPLHEDGSRTLEGVENRRKVEAMKDALIFAGHDCVIASHEWKDLPIHMVADRVNQLGSGRKSICINVHSNGAGNGVNWHSATGIDTFFWSKDGRYSKEGKRIATIFNNNAKEVFSGVTRNRGVKGRNFGMLRETNMPSILIEFGFHTNEKESLLMRTDDWVAMCAKTVALSCEKLETPIKARVKRITKKK